jgi:hypothetical protein
LFACREDSWPFVDVCRLYLSGFDLSRHRRLCRPFRRSIANPRRWPPRDRMTALVVSVNYSISTSDTDLDLDCDHVLEIHARRWSPRDRMTAALARVKESISSDGAELELDSRCAHGKDHRRTIAVKARYSCGCAWGRRIAARLYCLRNASCWNW